MSSILLKGGTILVHDAQDHVQVILEDLLVEGRFITKIGKDIQPPSSTHIINCQNKIVSPGFVNTHLHTVRTLARDDLHCTAFSKRCW